MTNVATCWRCATKRSRLRDNRAGSSSSTHAGPASTTIAGQRYAGLDVLDRRRATSAACADLGLDLHIDLLCWMDNEAARGIVLLRLVNHVTGCCSSPVPMLRSDVSDRRATVAPCANLRLDLHMISHCWRTK